MLVEQWRREYNTVRPHSACGGFPPAPEAIKPSPWFLRMPVLHGPPQVLESSKSEGLHFTIYFWRLARYLDIPTERIEESLPSDLEPWKYVSTSDQDGSGFAGYFTSDAEVEAFLRLFR